MLEDVKVECPECDSVDRRDFIRVLGTSTAALAVGGAAAVATPTVFGQTPPAQRQPKPAEALIQELFGTLTADQRRTVVRPYNDPGRIILDPNRAFRNETIGEHYTRPQQELIDRILKSVTSGDTGYRQICRRESDTRAWDGSQTMQRCGSHIFGEPGNGRQFAWLFTGHHLTVRCDGNSQPDTAFGGPIYYGHTPDPFSVRNVFYFQTRAVNSVYDALTEGQRRSAVITQGNPGEHMPSVQFRQQHPGLAGAELTADQKALVHTVLRECLSPYRKEDGDEVMDLVRRNGGLERLHLAFYRDRGTTNQYHWSYWRIEGPGFVWNYRVQPHVHCYVNIARAPQA